jgi:hypothetical protein
MNKKPLQIATITLAFVPLLTGAIGLTGVDDPIYIAEGITRNAILDSNLRFFGGMWFALGLAVMGIARKIERHTIAYRVIWGMIFVGGLGRILSMVALGMPPRPLIVLTVLEIVAAPIFIVWQGRVAESARRAAADSTAFRPRSALRRRITDE